MGPNYNRGDEKEALDESGYDTSDYGKGNKSFNDKWIKEETEATNEEVRESGHQARDDMEKDSDMGIPPDRHDQ